MKTSPLLVLGACFALGLTSPAPAAASASSTPTASSASAAASSSAPPPMFQLSSDSQFAFNLLEQLAIADGQGANAGEVLTAVQQITPGSFESWYTAWNNLAAGIQAVTDALDPSKYPVSVREASFHIATYFRAADFYLHGNPSDPRIDSLWDSQTKYFNQAISLMSPVPGRRITLNSTSGFQIPVIFYSPSADNCSRPTILAGNGYDGSQEELLHIFGMEVLARGWNFVTYEGPGQPTVRRDQNLGFIPEWWEVVTPVVDYLETLPEVDMSRLGLQGTSFGGTLAPRAAAYEHRFAAVICIDGLYDMFNVLMTAFGPKIDALFQSGNATAFDAEMNLLRTANSSPTDLRWVIDQGTWAFDTTSPFEWLTRLEAFTLGGGIAELVQCPVFVGLGQGDTQIGDSPIQAAQALGDKATLFQFNNSLGAGQHCQLGAESYVGQVSLDWFQDVVVDK